MNGRSSSRSCTAALLITWFIASSGCGELRLTQDVGDAQGKSEGRPSPPDADVSLADGFGFNDSEFSDEPLFDDGDNGPFDAGSFDGDFDAESLEAESFDGALNDESADGGLEDGEPLDGVPSDGATLEASAGWGKPAKIASLGNGTLVLAVDDERVYWANDAMALVDCPVSGCRSGPTVLSSKSTWGTIAVGSHMAFFVNAEALQSILDCAGGGCAAPTVYWTDPSVNVNTDGIGPIVSDASNLYWTDTVKIYSCPVGSTCTSPATLISKSAGTIGALAVSGDDVFYVDYNAKPAHIEAIPIGGGAPRVVCEAEELIFNLFDMVATGEYVYFLSNADNGLSIRQCAAEGGGRPAVFTQGYANFSLAADASRIYTVDGYSTVRACALGATCTEMETIASGQYLPNIVAVNSTAVFWGTESGIYSAAKKR